MVNLGIIGVGEEWETTYAPILASLAQRVRVVQVYDPVAGRAEQIAGYLRAHTSQGVLALVRAPQVDAALVLDSNWHGPALWPFLCASRKPIYLGTKISADVALLEHLHATSILTGAMIMPELRWRYTPATQRLRELLATCLGPAHEVTVRLNGPAAQANGDLINLLDWCGYVLQASARKVHCQPATAPSQHRWKIEYAPLSSRTTSLTAYVEFPSPVAGDQVREPTFTITTRTGSAEIAGPHAIRWQSRDRCGDEPLQADRTAVHVTLDHFCRRVVGGLIPVADLRDICRHLQTLQALDACRLTGDPQSVPAAD